MREVRELRGNVLARSTRAITERIPGLRHEPINHPMELQPIVETVPYQFTDPSDMVRGKVGPELNHDRPVLEFHVKAVWLLGLRRSRDTKAQQGEAARDE